MQQDVSGDVCPLVADVQRVEPSFEFGGEARLIEDEGIGAVGSNPLGVRWMDPGDVRSQLSREHQAALGEEGQTRTDPEAAVSRADSELLGGGKHLLAGRLEGGASFQPRHESRQIEAHDRQREGGGGGA